jgi:hypothetical protein
MLAPRLVTGFTARGSSDRVSLLEHNGDVSDGREPERYVLLLDSGRAFRSRQRVGLKDVERRLSSDK